MFFKYPSKTVLPLTNISNFSQKSSTWSILCDENIIDVPLSFNSNITFLKSSILSGSSPENGSSNIKSSGSFIIADINWTFCWVPFDNVFIFLSL